LKKPTLSYGIIGAAIGVVGIAMMMYSAPLLLTTVYAQNSTTTSTTTITPTTNTTTGAGGAAATNATTPQNMTTTTTNTTNLTNTTAAETAGTAAVGATNVTTTTMTTGTTITNLTWFDGKVDQLSPENIQYQQTDPAFARLAQTTADCLTDLNGIYAKVEANPQFSEAPGSATAYTPGDIQGQNQCTDMINQGVAQFCESTDSATFDSQKCEEARLMTGDYVGFAEALFV
jgi:hypothetical protein